MRIIPLIALGFFLAPALHAQSMDELMKSAMGGNKVKVEEDKSPFKPLGFTGSYTWEITSFKNGVQEKGSPKQLAMAFDDEHMAWIPQAEPNGEKMSLVFDLKSKVNYTLMTDKKGKRTGVKMKAMRVTMNDVEGNEKSEGKVERTNETKVIEGHTCRKYIFSDDDGRGEAWIAEDVKFNAFEALGSMVGSRADRWQMAPYQGMVMENTWTSTDGKEKVVMRTRDLVVGKVDKSLFSTAGYEIQDMTNLPVFGK
ncbi:MAG TPA: DUF4412 domain-containing protein [Flavobacteriales bacterium]|nr:DUF4412 domain-containing protein [Flavobacteriales bacterium]